MNSFGDSSTRWRIVWQKAVADDQIAAVDGAFRALPKGAGMRPGSLLEETGKGAGRPPVLLEGRSSSQNGPTASSPSLARQEGRFRVRNGCAWALRPFLETGRSPTMEGGSVRARLLLPHPTTDERGDRHDVRSLP